MFGFRLLSSSSSREDEVIGEIHAEANAPVPRVATGFHTAAVLLESFLRAVDRVADVYRRLVWLVRDARIRVGEAINLQHVYMKFDDIDGVSVFCLSLIPQRCRNSFEFWSFFITEYFKE